MLCPGFKKAVIQVKVMLATSFSDHIVIMNGKGFNGEGILIKAMELYDLGARA
jgi:hypothetical protein